MSVTPRVCGRTFRWLWYIGRSFKMFIKNTPRLSKILLMCDTKQLILLWDALFYVFLLMNLLMAIWILQEKLQLEWRRFERQRKRRNRGKNRATARLYLQYSINSKRNKNLAAFTCSFTNATLKSLRSSLVFQHSKRVCFCRRSNKYSLSGPIQIAIVCSYDH